jgi:hypothetical protein
MASSGSSNNRRMLATLGRLRSQFATVRSYGRLLLANALPRRAFRNPRAIVCLDSTFPDIHDRRYFYLILQTLLDSGYHVDVVWKISLADYRRLYRTYEGLIVRLEGLRVVSKCPAPSKSMLLFTNVPSKSSEFGWKKVIEIDCDILTTRRSDHDLRMPYFMHPEQYKYDGRERLAKMQRTHRQLRILFSGNVAEEFYNSTLPGNKLTRFEIVQALRTMPGVEKPSDENEFHELFSRADNCCVVHDRRNFAVPDEDWLETIARSDFFLCLPGSRMPMCHNVIEAMAVGTIPILNYAEWFDPPLRHAETCIEFNSMEELRGRIAEILSLTTDAVQAMRERVIRYHGDHLSPVGFRKKLEESPYNHIKLIVNTEYLREPAPVLLRF